jgi:DNA-binding transcriptional LysR family regulator
MQEFAQSGICTMQRAGLFELNAVVAVSSHRSFRRAAAELGLSPSALSHAVATLEQRLGVRLFNRTTRSVSLSEAGERFLKRVQPALGEIADAMEAVNELRDTPTGTLRINASESAARQILVPIVFEFLRRYPDMEVDIAAEGRLVDIVAAGFDAGIRIAEMVPRGMIAVPCAPPQCFAVVGSPAYFKRHSHPRMPDDLKAHNCIRYRFSSGTIFRWEFEKRGEEIDLDVPGSLTLDNQALMREAALHGVGLAYVNEWAVEADLAVGRLIRVLQDWTPPFPGPCLYYPGHRHVPAGLRAFVGVVKDVMAHRETALNRS